MGTGDEVFDEMRKKGLVTAEEVDKKLGERLAANDEATKRAYDDMLSATSHMTLDTVLGHEACGREDCRICGMKKEIDGSAYSRGLHHGAELATKMGRLTKK